MIGYTLVGTNDLARARQFYSELLGEIGAQVAIEGDRVTLYAAQAGQPMFGICTPFDEQPATVGNGSMVTLALESADQVNALYAKALALGGTSEGEPGQRLPGFYMAYFRDLDGNKIALFFGG